MPAILLVGDYKFAARRAFDGSAPSASPGSVRRARPERAARRDDPRGPIRIEPITLHHPLGYFNYFVEKLPNYTEGYEQAGKVFRRDLAGTQAAEKPATSPNPLAPPRPRHHLARLGTGQRDFRPTPQRRLRGGGGSC
jgi:hypothetical protein